MCFLEKKMKKYIKIIVQVHFFNNFVLGPYAMLTSIQI